jgi:hypothetical protein
MLVYQRVTDLELVAEEVTLKNQEDVFLSVLGLAESMICYNISQYTMENNGHTTATEESIGNGWELFFLFLILMRYPLASSNVAGGLHWRKKGN